MKKFITATLVSMLILALTACGKSSDDTSKPTSAPNSTATPTGEVTTTPTDAPIDVSGPSVPGLNPVEQVFHPASSGVYATIKVDASIKFDDTSAWLGLCPAGKRYITELEADEVDIIYFYADSRMEESDPYVFACDFEDVEDGTYALVVTTSDDAAIGYVVIQAEMTKLGGKLVFDFANAVINERPAK